MKHIARLLAGSFAATALAFAPIAAFADSDGASAASNDVVTLDLYNLTDIHGHIEPVEARPAKDAPADAEKKYKEAGLASVACYLNEARKTNPNSQFTLLGDNIGASPFTSGSDNDNPTIEALNAMGVFASTIGNHEFDKGVQALKERFAGKGGFTKIGFPYLGANVDGMDEIGDYKIWESPSGVKVAYIGAIEDDVATKLAPGTVDSLTFNKPVPVINKLATELKESGKADVVVAMFDNDVERSYPKMGKDVDAIMGGDTHKPYFDFNMVKADDGHVITATASGSFTDNLSNLQIQFDKSSGKVVKSQAIRIDATTLMKCGQDPAVKGIVDKAVEKAAAAKSVVVAEGAGNFYRGTQETVKVTDKGKQVTVGENRGTESTMGGLVADAMRGSFKDLQNNPIDIGIINAGGIRADLEPKSGKVTVGDIFAFMPFSNEVGYVKMTGAQFVTLLEQQWKVLGKDSTRPLLKLGLSSNVRYTFDPTKPMGSRITSVLIDGKPIDREKVYTVGSVTFLLSGGDSFDILKDPSIAKTLTPISAPYALDREWMQSYLKDNPRIQPRTATQSTGVSYQSEVDGVSAKIHVSLRGLSFAHDGEFRPDTVTVKFGDTTTEVKVNNTLEDANAANENAIVTADGVGFTEPVTLEAKAVCSDPAGGKVRIPLTISANGTEIVSAAAGLGTLVTCPKIDSSVSGQGAGSAQGGKPGSAQGGNAPGHMTGPADSGTNGAGNGAGHATGNAAGNGTGNAAGHQAGTKKLKLTGANATWAGVGMVVLIGLGSAAVTARRVRD